MNSNNSQPEPIKINNSNSIVNIEEKEFTDENFEEEFQENKEEIDYIKSHPKHEEIQKLEEKNIKSKNELYKKTFKIRFCNNLGEKKDFNGYFKNKKNYLDIEFDKLVENFKNKKDLVNFISEKIIEQIDKDNIKDKDIICIEFSGEYTSKYRLLFNQKLVSDKFEKQEDITMEITTAVLENILNMSENRKILQIQDITCEGLENYSDITSCFTKEHQKMLSNFIKNNEKKISNIYIGGTSYSTQSDINYIFLVDKDLQTKKTFCFNNCLSTHKEIQEAYKKFYNSQFKDLKILPENEYNNFINYVIDGKDIKEDWKDKKITDETLFRQKANVCKFRRFWNCLDCCKLGRLSREVDFDNAVKQINNDENLTTANILNNYNRNIGGVIE